MSPDLPRSPNKMSERLEAHVIRTTVTIRRVPRPSSRPLASASAAAPSAPLRLGLFSLSASLPLCFSASLRLCLSAQGEHSPGGPEFHVTNLGPFFETI